MQQSAALAARVTSFASEDAARVIRAYELLLQREPTKEERQLALEFLHAKSNAWPEYAQVLLSSNEFIYLN
jgi:hypothetical protein